MRLPWKRQSILPAALSARLSADELVVGLAQTMNDGPLLAATRLGLWVVDGDDAELVGWHLVAKAKLDAAALTVTLVEEVEQWDELTVVRDLPPREFRLEKAVKLTDQVHARVRRSVAASRHLPWPGAGGWVALRRVPGRDGLVSQLRLDPGADPATAGFAAAVAAVAADLRRSGSPGVTGVDD